ncbi:hypothetical protein BD414DRAFT_304884 [Trametes punicea]|nr:hypothetical protein BD414DRAFT_304884 [Trametes punicea]
MGKPSTFKLLRPNLLSVQLRLTRRWHRTCRNEANAHHSKGTKLCEKQMMYPTPAVVRHTGKFSILSKAWIPLTARLHIPRINQAAHYVRCGCAGSLNERRRIVANESDFSVPSEGRIRRLDYTDPSTLGKRGIEPGVAVTGHCHMGPAKYGGIVFIEMPFPKTRHILKGRAAFHDLCSQQETTWDISIFRLMCRERASARF